MNKRMGLKNRPDAYAFVLWGEAFREIPATIFVGELRRAGIRVKVVGLNAQRTTGLYGLKLTPDISLDQALHLVDSAICIIIPSDLEQLQQFDYDPRITELLHRARCNNARIIVGGMSDNAHWSAERLDQTDRPSHALPQKEFIEFPESNRLFEFAAQTANALTHVGY